LLSIEAQARREAQRLEALWRIVNTPSLRGNNLILAMLREGAVAMRPGQRYVGMLGHIEGSDFVLDAVAGEFSAGEDDVGRLMPVGSRFPRSQGLYARDLTAGRTQSWEDCQAVPDVPSRTRELGVRGQIATQFVVAGAIHILDFGTREPPADTPYGPEDYAYVELLGSFFARHLELEHMQRSLVGAELLARRHAERLEALWQVANNPALRGDALMLAMLEQAAAAIRPAQRFRGQLGRIDGDAVVVVNVGTDGLDDGTDVARLQIGQRKPLEQTVIPRIKRTEAWDDLAALESPPLAVAELGWRAVISTLFDAAGSHYVLTFASSTPAVTAFNADDLAYIGVLASAFANQLEVDRLQGSLSDEEQRSRQHAERLDALWQIANNPTLRGDDLILAMLLQAAAAIRPGQRFRGVLGQIEGSEVVILASGRRPGDDESSAKLLIPQRTAIAQTIIPPLGRTDVFEDLLALPDRTKNMVALGWRAAVSTQFEAGGSRYSLTFASSEPAATPFSSADMAYIDTVASSFAKQLELNVLADSLRAEEEQSRRHAVRLEALWKIVNDPALRHNELLLAMLAESATAIRPDQDFHGTLLRVKGNGTVVDALGRGEHLFGNIQPSVDDKLPLADSIAGEFIAENGGTRSWDDLLADDDRSAHSGAHGLRSVVVTTFLAGGTTWGLLFASTEASTRPLTPQDRAFIEVVASYFANHIQQRWQFERIAYQQSHDVLTGLLNRSQFRSQARSAARTSAHYAVILIDIDAFGEINESYGHTIGDALLVEVGNALRLRAIGDEIVGRVGDDVFGVYIGTPISKEFVLGRALNFADAFSHGFSAGDREGKEFIARTAGLGVAVAPDDGTLIDAILSHADAALVRAKERGPGSLVFYEAGMEGDAHRRTALRNEIAEAVAGDQFELYYQPHVETQTGKVTGCEALIRWNHPVRGLLLPQHFIPFAEQNGIIASIDTWVMEHACAAANELAAARPDFRLYFNLSGRQAGDPKVIRALTTAARRGVKLGHLGVEVTETDAMRDVEATRVVCRALRRLNVRIAIDDFGTGYSSLTSLKRLPVDIVKIDRSFISGVLTDPNDETIADTIITIAARFGFESLAEGVEQLGEIDWLRQRPCRYMQGHAVSHPLPIAAFKAWLAEREAGG
jgi:diguanylate cyclase (GGDEF)-like protein